MFGIIGYKARKQARQDYKRYPFFMKRAINRFGAFVFVWILVIAGLSLASIELQYNAINKRIDARQTLIQKMVQEQFEQIKQGMPVTSLTLPKLTNHPYEGAFSFAFLIIGSIIILYFLNKYTTLFGTFAWKKRAIVWAHKYRFDICEYCLTPFDQQENGTCTHCHHEIDTDRLREKWDISMHHFLGRLHEHPYYIKRARSRSILFAVLCIPIGVLIALNIPRYITNPFLSGVLGGISGWVPFYLWMLAEKKICACRWNAITLATKNNMEICSQCVYPLSDLQPEQGRCPECGYHYNKTETRRLWKFAALSMLNPSYLDKETWNTLRNDWKLWEDEDILTATLKNAERVLPWCKQHIPVGDPLAQNA